MPDHADDIARLAPYAERARALTGWGTHPGIDVRRLDPPPPWDYEALARELAAEASSVVDLGTGGGEVLARIVAGMQPGAGPRRIVATEEWARNAPIARDRLAPLGMHVVRGDSLRLPFAPGAFDLVLDRHEALEPAEVARVLRPGGRVLTQQVATPHWAEIDAYFPGRAFDFDHYRIYAAQFEAAGMRIVRREHYSYRDAFGGLGDLVYWLTASPYRIEGFDVAADIEPLLAIERDLTTAEGIVLTDSRYIMLAEKA